MKYIITSTVRVLQGYPKLIKTMPRQENTLFIFYFLFIFAFFFWLKQKKKQTLLKNLKNISNHKKKINHLKKKYFVFVGIN